MVKLEIDRFLTELHKLYERNKTKGTVWVTMKRSERGAPCLSSLPCLLSPLVPGLDRATHCVCSK